MYPAKGFKDLDQSLRNRILYDLSKIDGQAVDESCINSKHIRNPYSDVFKITLGGNLSKRGFYLKIPKRTPSNQDLLEARMEAEFKIMNLLAEYWKSSSTHGVPQAVSFYPEFPAIMTTEAEGVELGQKYHRSSTVFFPRDRTDTLKAVYHCGLWLREFQEKTRSQSGPFDFSDLTVYCKVRLEELRRTFDTQFPESLAEAIYRKFEVGQYSDKLQKITHCGRHNDFASHNIIVQNQCIRVIDFSMYDTGPSTYDFCNFWLELEMMKLDRRHSIKFLQNTQAAFIQGYGCLQTEADNLAFDFSRLRYTLNRLLTTLHILQSGRGNSSYRRRIAEACFQWLFLFTKSKNPIGPQ